METDIDVTDLRGSSLCSDDAEALDAFAARIRHHSIKAIANAGSGHPGASLSMAEALAVLYARHLRFDPKDPDNPNADCFVLSKGHAAPALYVALASVGFFPMEDLSRLRRIDSHLQGHPDMTKTPGVAMSTGRLGGGMGAALGMAIDARLRNSDSLTVVGLGDGEICEGVCWEALGLAGKLRLGRLVVLYDGNGLGLGGLIGKFSCWDVPSIVELMGWKVLLVNGHNVSQLDEALRIATASTKPCFIAMETTKGRGVSFMENNPEWHGKATDSQQTTEALSELSRRLNEPLVERLLEKRLREVRVPAGRRPVFRKLTMDFNRWKKSQPTRNVFGEWLIEAMGQTEGCVMVVPVQADVAKCVMTHKAEEMFGLINDGLGRCLDVGIREQLMVSIMAGLARSGFFIPIGATFASFVDIGLDLAKHLFARNNLRGILIGTHGGLQVAGDGASHMDLTSLATYASIPGIRVFDPGDPYSTAKVLNYAFNSQEANPGLVYVRLTRSEVRYLSPGDGVIESMEEVIPEKGYRTIIPRGSGQPGITMVASGAMLETAVKAAEIINSGHGGMKVGKIIEAFAPTSFGKLSEKDLELFSGSDIVATMIDASPETLATPVMEHLFKAGRKPRLLAFGADFASARSGTIPEVYGHQGLLPGQVADAISSEASKAVPAV